MAGSRFYRVKQLWWAVTARPLSPTEQAIIDQLLNAAERELFGRFSFNDQQHSLRVVALLREAGHTQSDLLKSALLHDIGKTAVNLTVLDRCLVVLGSAVAPRRSQKWGGAGQNWTPAHAVGWRKPFVVKQHHPAWSAQMAEAAGTAAPVCALIRHHQAIIPPDDHTEEARLLRLHQWADNLS